MSGNHRYNTPAEGATGWHIPLNENFRSLDADVEVRAPEGERDQYEPKDGAKFLATDSGAVYIGDGSAWQKLGSVADGENSSSGSIYARPGEIQATLDNYQASGSIEYGYFDSTMIKLVPGLEYSTDTEDFPIRLREGTMLDLNGCDLDIYEDTDVFYVEAGSGLANGRIRYVDAGSGFSSRVFELVGSRTRININNFVEMRHVRTFGHPDNNGTVFYLEGAENEIEGAVFRGIHSRMPGESFIKMRCGPSADGWVNGNMWLGTYTFGGDRIIDIHSADTDSPVAGNYLQGVFHPRPARSKWLATISGSRKAMRNHFELTPAWDVHRFNEGIVKLDGDAHRNVFKDTMAMDIPNQDWIDNRKWVNNARDSNHWVNEIDGKVY